MNTLRLYRNLAEGPVLALTIVCDAEGRVSFSPGQRYSETAMEMVGSGAASVFTPRRITPDEGLSYIQAVYDMLDQSSAWSVGVEVVHDDASDGGSGG